MQAQSFNSLEEGASLWERVNAWLSTYPKINIKFVTQSESIDENSWSLKICHTIRIH
jgi:murein tripeptide amidase MpaA